MTAPITYELATFKDIVDKVPADRIRDCMDELGVLLSQAAATRDLFMAAAEEIGLDPAGVIPKLPDHISWIDDGKGDLKMKVKASANGGAELTDVFTIETHLNK